MPQKRHTASNGYFNPRSREGSDSQVLVNYQVSGIFQSTLPRGERPNTSLCVWQAVLDFNPRSREGSDLQDPAL